MTIGIYALYWEEQDLIYIGQSQNIEARYKEHLYKMKSNKHTNYKVQNAFNLYGQPVLQIIEECNIEMCNELEIYYTEEFDSINKGLNIVEAGLVGWGVNSNASKYTKWQVLKVFALLCLASYSFEKIAQRAKVSLSLVQDVSCGRSHAWLKTQYPQKYQSMMGTPWKSKVQEINSVTYIFQHPQNGVVYTKSLIKLAQKFNLNSAHLSNLIAGRRKTHKGWRYVSSST